MAGEALTAVTGQTETLSSYATEAIASAEGALNTLGSGDYGYIAGGTLSPIGTFIPYPVTLIAPPPNPDIGNAPEGIEIEIPQKPTRPTITLPTSPNLKELTVPPLPPTTMPTMDTVDLPEGIDIELPELPEIDIKDFEIEPPDPINLDIPEWSFDIDDVLVSDDPMVVAMIARLKSNIVNGGTGLTAAIEDAIWARDLERMEQQLSDSTDKVVSMWAKKGFSLPDGLLAHSLSEVQKEYMNKKIDRAREIAIEQAKLEQTNLFKSMEIATNLVFKLIEEMTRHADLVFRTQESTAKFFNEYIRLQIEAQNSIIEVFRVRVQMYEISVRANLTKVEVYKAQIDGELAKSNLNESDVRRYSAEITAAVAKYKGVLEADDIIARIFSAEVQGVLAQSQVNESMVRAYAEEIRGVMQEVEVYKAEIEGMTAELGVEKAKIDANIAQVTAWAKGADAQIVAYSTSVEVFKAQGQTNIAIAEMGNKAAQVILGAQIAQAQVGASVTEAVGRSLAASYATRMEAAKGVAVSASSLAAGAMAALHASASMSYSESMELEEA